MGLGALGLECMCMRASGGSALPRNKEQRTTELAIYSLWYNRGYPLATGKGK
jgi:hypothetical protein